MVMAVSPLCGVIGVDSPARIEDIANKYNKTIFCWLQRRLLGGIWEIAHGADDDNSVVFLNEE